MTGLYIVGGIAIAAVVIWYVACEMPKQKRANEMEGKLDRLGDPIGKSRQEIVSVLGEPDEVAQQGDGEAAVYQLGAVTLTFQFKDGACTGRSDALN